MDSANTNTNTSETTAAVTAVATTTTTTTTKPDSQEAPPTITPQDTQQQQQQQQTTTDNDTKVQSSPNKKTKRRKRKSKRPTNTADSDHDSHLSSTGEGDNNNDNINEEKEEEEEEGVKPPAKKRSRKSNPFQTLNGRSSSILIVNTGGSESFQLGTSSSLSSSPAPPQQVLTSSLSAVHVTADVTTTAAATCGEDVGNAKQVMAVEADTDDTEAGEGQGKDADGVLLEGSINGAKEAGFNTTGIAMCSSNVFTACDMDIPSSPIKPLSNNNSGDNSDEEEEEEEEEEEKVEETINRNTINTTNTYVDREREREDEEEEKDLQRDTDVPVKVTVHEEAQNTHFECYETTHCRKRKHSDDENDKDESPNEFEGEVDLCDALRVSHSSDNNNNNKHLQQNTFHQGQAMPRPHDTSSSSSSSVLLGVEVDGVLLCKIDSALDTLFRKCSPMLFSACFVALFSVFVAFYFFLVGHSSPFVFCDSNGAGAPGCVPCPEHGVCVNGALTCEAPYARYVKYCVEDMEAYHKADAIAKAAHKSLSANAWTHKNCGYPKNPCLSESEIFARWGKGCSDKVVDIAIKKVFSRHGISSYHSEALGETFYCSKKMAVDRLSKCTAIIMYRAVWNNIVAILSAVLLIYGGVLCYKVLVGINLMFEEACTFIRVEVTARGKQYVLVQDLHDYLMEHRSKTWISNKMWAVTLRRLNNYDAVKKGYAKINGRQVPVLSWGV